MGTKALIPLGVLGVIAASVCAQRILGPAPALGARIRSVSVIKLAPVVRAGPFGKTVAKQLSAAERSALIKAAGHPSLVQIGQWLLTGTQLVASDGSSLGADHPVWVNTIGNYFALDGKSTATITHRCPGHYLLVSCMAGYGSGSGTVVYDVNGGPPQMVNLSGMNDADLLVTVPSPGQTIQVNVRTTPNSTDTLYLVNASLTDYK